MGRRVKLNAISTLYFYSFQPYAISFLFSMRLGGLVWYASLLVGVVLFARSNTHQQCFFNMHISSLMRPFAGIKSLFTEVFYCYGMFIGFLCFLPISLWLRGYLLVDFLGGRELCLLYYISM